MKFGVLTYSYANANNFARSVCDAGFFSMNLGDYMQTLAVRGLYREFNIPDEQTVDIDRDRIANYAGEPATLIMSGVFFPWSFPLPETITPIFIGFHASEKVIKENLDLFKHHEPIGCRDTNVTTLFNKYGVAAFTSGCVTMTFDKRILEPQVPKVLIIGGGGSGSFPFHALKTMPEELLQTAEFVWQRKIVHRHPLDISDMADAERYAKYLLDDYRARATLVVTALHHATTPCLSSGIPVILCREDQNTRFSFLRSFMPVYTPDRSS